MDLGPLYLEGDGLEVVVAHPQAVRVAVDGLLIGVALRRPASLAQIDADLPEQVIIQKPEHG